MAVAVAPIATELMKFARVPCPMAVSEDCYACASNPTAVVVGGGLGPVTEAGALVTGCLGVHADGCRGGADGDRVRAAGNLTAPGILDAEGVGVAGAGDRSHRLRGSGRKARTEVITNMGGPSWSSSRFRRRSAG